MTLRGDPSVGTADISPVRGDKTTRTNGVRPMLPLKGEVGRLRPTRRGLCTAPSIFHRTSGVLTQFVHVSLRGAAKAATWQSVSPLQKIPIFHRICGAAGNQSLPCVKGGGVRKDTGGIDAEQFTLCSANSDCSMSKNPAAHNRKPHAETNRWGTIPQPFG